MDIALNLKNKIQNALAKLGQEVSLNDIVIEKSKDTAHGEYARITKIYEPYQVNVDPEKCLMDQGILCLGPATVGGCNAKCTKAGQPCRGCYGPTQLVQEHGASALTAIASLFPVLDDDPTCDEQQIIEIMKTIKDPLGYFYAYTVGKSLIQRTVVEEKA